MVFLLLGQVLMVIRSIDSSPVRRERHGEKMAMFVLQWGPTSVASSSDQRWPWQRLLSMFAEVVFPREICCFKPTVYYSDFSPFLFVTEKGAHSCQSCMVRCTNQHHRGDDIIIALSFVLSTFQCCRKQRRSISSSLWNDMCRTQVRCTQCCQGGEL